MKNKNKEFISWQVNRSTVTVQVKQDCNFYQCMSHWFDLNLSTEFYCCGCFGVRLLGKLTLPKPHKHPLFVFLFLLYDIVNHFFWIICCVLNVAQEWMLPISATVRQEKYLSLTIDMVILVIVILNTSQSSKMIVQCILWDWVNIFKVTWFFHQGPEAQEFSARRDQACQHFTCF